MRAAPPPRKSRSRCLTKFCLRLRQVCTGYGLKKRWHLHKLHKVRRKGEIIVSPLSGVHVEDMVNLPTGLQNKSSRGKPLLIAAFSKGCAKSPQLRLLQRNKLYGLPLTKRKYKLKEFEASVIDKNPNGTIRMSHFCASRVGSIKKATLKDADVRVIFHNNNVIKSINLDAESDVALHSPQLLEFTSRQSIRIRDYPSLARKSVELGEGCENLNNSKERTSLPSFNNEIKSQTFKLAEEPLSDYSPSLRSGPTGVSLRFKPRVFQLRKFIRITKYSSSNMLVSYSKLFTFYNS